MNNFSVSVVIPLYNKAPFIRATLTSVLSQTLTPAEIIIVDDGSTDGSVAAIADLIGDRVRVVSQANAGPGPSRNRGVLEATQDWIALVDGDDLWLATHLESFAKLSAIVPSADILVNGHSRLAYGSSPELDEPTQVDVGKWDFFANRGGVNSSCIAIRRSTYNENGGFRSFCPGEDTEFWFRLALRHEYAKSSRKTAIYHSCTHGLMDEYDRTSATYELPELYKTISDSLHDPRYEHLHSQIVFYRDCVLARSIGLALYNGNSRRARDFIAMLSPSFLRRLGVMRALAWLPGPAVRAIAVSRTWLLSLVSPYR